MLYLSPAITVYCCALALVLGACMGSFLNCFAWRIVHQESILRGRSHCDACGHVLGARDLVPVLSYLFSHGKCRYCGQKLSRRHLLAELSTALTYLAILLRYDISLQTLEYLVFASVLLACAFADLEGYMIPDRFVLFGAAVRILALVLGQATGSQWIDSLLGGFAVGGGLLLVVLLYEKLRHVEAMGGGDIKLLFLTGLTLGWIQNLLCLFVSCLFGIAFGLIRSRGRQKDQPFPWGPSIAAAAIVTLLAGGPLVEAYLNLFF